MTTDLILVYLIKSKKLVQGGIGDLVKGLLDGLVMSPGFHQRPFFYSNICSIFHKFAQFFNV